MVAVFQMCGNPIFLDSCFPEDIMVEILSRLPPKSLMRFKCVHKSWNALIKSHDFAAKQLSVSKKNNSSSPSILFKRRMGRPYKWENVLSLFNVPDNYFDDAGDEKNCYYLDSILEDVQFPVAVTGSTLINNPDVKFAGHCDGIVCLVDTIENLVLFNPTIKEFRLVPKCSLPCRRGDAFGFGFDHKSKTYKLVRISSSKTRLWDLTRLAPKAEVYNLFTNSWKEIETGPLTTIWLKNPGVYCKGFLYWSGFDVVASGHGKYIISFDISDETFHLIVPPPTVCRSSTGDILELWNNESVALRRQQPNIVEMWVMDASNAGVESASWTKHLTFNWPVGFGPAFLIKTTIFFDERSKQLVLVGIKQCAVIFINVHTDECIYIPLDGRNDCSVYEAVQYVNSIVPIK